MKNKTPASTLKTYIIIWAILFIKPFHLKDDRFTKRFITHGEEALLRFPERRMSPEVLEKIPGESEMMTDTLILTTLRTFPSKP